MVNLLLNIAFIIFMGAFLMAAIGLIIMLFDLFVTSNFDEIFFKIAFWLLGIGVIYQLIIVILIIKGVLK